MTLWLDNAVQELLVSEFAGQHKGVFLVAIQGFRYS
jgi:hypothetical protein